jgi:hypothetical protein
MKTKIIAWYSVFIGISVIAIWIVTLLNQDVPEGKLELSFHLISEFIMAFLCLLSGIMLFKNKSYAKFLNTLGLGMVIYSVLNAAGYYAGKNEPIMMILFLTLFIFTLTVIVLHYNQLRN